MHSEGGKRRFPLTDLNWLLLKFVSRPDTIISDCIENNLDTSTEQPQQNPARIADRAYKNT